MRAPESIIAETDAILDDLNELLKTIDSVTCGELSEAGDETLVSYTVLRQHLGNAQKALKNSKAYLNSDLENLEFPLTSEERQKYITAFVACVYNQPTT